MLSDGDLMEWMDSGELVVDNLEDEDVQIQPASIDVRLAAEIKVPTAPADDPDFVCDPVNGVFPEHDVIDISGGYKLEPYGFVLGSTVEWVEFSPQLAGVFDGRSTMGRVGLFVHVSAGFLDPGYKGEVTLEIFNGLPYPTWLRPGMRIGQIVVHRTESPARRPYGEGRCSKYQGQRGPQEARSERHPHLNKVLG